MNNIDEKKLSLIILELISVIGKIEEGKDSEIIYNIQKKYDLNFADIINIAKS